MRIYNNGLPWKQQFSFNTSQTADITGWSAGTSLPANIGNAQVIVTKSYVYLLGGYLATTPTANVYVAPINGNGTLGTWAAGTALPAALAYSQAIITKDRVFLLGGINSSYNAVTTVYTAPINGDGTLGTWTTSGSLSTAKYAATAFVTTNKVYLVGGFTSAYVDDVQVADINSDGTLGTWAAASPATIGVSYAYAQAVVTNGYVYIIGGKATGGTAQNCVMRGVINTTNGVVSSWSYIGASLPGASSNAQAVITSSRVFLFGGSQGTAVYTAPIDSGGVIGTWTTGTSLPGSVIDPQVITTNSKIYTLGGYTVSTVYVANYSGGLNDYTTSEYTEIPGNAYFDGPNTGFSVSGGNSIPAYGPSTVFSLTGDTPEVNQGTLAISVPKTSFFVRGKGSISFLGPDTDFAISGNVGILGGISLLGPKTKFSLTGSAANSGKINIDGPPTSFSLSGNTGNIGHVSLFGARTSFSLSGSAGAPGGSNKIDITTPATKFCISTESDRDFGILQYVQGKIR